MSKWFALVLQACQGHLNSKSTRLTAVLYGYFAVSGDLEESAICSLCGFIAEAEYWEHFDHAWRTSLAGSRDRFDAVACLCGTGSFQSWDVHRRHALLADLSGLLTHSALLPVGAFVVRDHFFNLSAADRSVLANDGIENPLDLVFYDWTERTICRVHEQSEKVSLLLGQASPSRTEKYRELFSKHLSRYLLGPHLTGALAFAKVCDHSPLQAAKLLGEAVRLVEKQRWFSQQEGTSFLAPPAVQQIADQIHRQGRFDAAELCKLIKRLEKSA